MSVLVSLSQVPRHIVVIRSSEGVDFIKPRTVEQVERAIRLREKRGAVIEKVGCSASCWCNGEFLEG